MPEALERSLRASYRRQKQRGRLKGVDEGQYVYGSEAMQQQMGRRPHRKDKSSKKKRPNRSIGAAY